MKPRLLPLINRTQRPQLLRTFNETKHLPYASRDLYSVIIDIDHYHEFLPWCIASRVREKRDDGSLIADLSIGYGGLREMFTSHVIGDPNAMTVETTQQKGPFRHMWSRWSLKNERDGGTTVSFEIEFEFRSVLFQKLIGTVFDLATRQMISAFEERAAQLH